MFRKWLKHLNNRFDNIEEPKRLLVLIALVIPGIILSNANEVIPSFIGMGWLLIILAIRALYIHGKL